MMSSIAVRESSHRDQEKSKNPMTVLLPHNSDENNRQVEQCPNIHLNYFRGIHVYADDILTLSEDPFYVSSWNSIGLKDENTKPVSPDSSSETSSSLTEPVEVQEPRAIDQIPAYVEISKEIAVDTHFSGSEEQVGFHSYFKNDASSPPCSRTNYNDMDVCADLKECSTASTVVVSSDPTSTSSREVGKYLDLNECSAASRQLSSTPITFSEESGCSTTPSSSTMKPNQVCLEDLPETLPVTREDEENSIQSLESSSEESSSTSTVLSAGSYSTVLESDDSSESSLFSDDSFSRYERTVSSNISLKSVKLRKSFERREKELRRLSLGNKGYRIYLSRQEELVQQHSYNRLSRDPKISPSNKPIADENFVESGFQTDRGSGPASQLSITDNVQRRFLFERYHTAPGIVTLLIYIIAHVSCYDALHQLFINSFFRYSYYKLAYLISFVVGIFLLRLTGSIWNWGTVSLYEGVKFDLHNKLRLGDIDIKFIRWVNKRKRLQQFLSIIGIYLCFISVEFALSELFLPKVCRVSDKVIEGLPIKVHGMETWLDSVLEKNGLQPSYDTDAIDEPSEPFLSFLESGRDDKCTISKDHLEEADSNYLYSKLSYYSYFTLYGWGEDASLISSDCQVLLSLTNAIISVSLLFVMGIGFWDD